MLRVSPHRLILPAAIAFIAISGTVLGVIAYQQRTAALASGENLISTFAQLIEEQTSRTIQAAELTLDAAIERIGRLQNAQRADEQTVQHALRELIVNSPYIRAIWLTDADGVVLFNSDDGNIGMNVADRSYFQYYLDEPAEDFDIHSTVVSRTNSKPFIPATKSLRQADGRLAGVIVAALEPTYFNEAWNISQGSSSLSIALFGLDSVMIMRTPFEPAAIGRSFANSELFRHVLAAPTSGSLHAISEIDKVWKIFAYRSIRSHPDLTILVSDTYEQILTSWRHFAWILASGWAAASALLLLLTLSLRREWIRRTAAENERSRSYQRVNTIMDHIADGVISIDKRGTIKDFRKSAERIFGYDESEVVGKNINVLMPQPYKREHDDYLAAYQKTGMPKIIGKGREVSGLRKNGEVFPIELTVTEVRGLSGGTEYVGTVRDISARKAVEAQLRHSQKMEAVGQLTGGIAHDFNNMLTVILGTADLLLEDSKLGREKHQLIKAIFDSAVASSELVRRLMAFARRQPLEPRSVDVEEFILKVKLLLNRTLGENIVIKTLLSNGSWKVLIDPAQLESAILNLALNARDAMSIGGEIIIERADMPLDAESAAALDVPPGDYVMIAVSDNGSGMPPEVMNRVFEPFFTTKGLGKGTGLGLNMVYGFVRQSGGGIKIYSEVGHGTTIKLFLPRTQEAVSSALPAAPSQRPASVRGERILLVEDDPQVRAHVAQQLTKLGYVITVASNGHEAIKHLEGAEHFDLLFTDIVMPGGLTGRDVAERGLALRPQMRVLYTSGYSDNAVTHHGHLDPGVRLLSKPYRLNQLATKVREALDLT